MTVTALPTKVGSFYPAEREESPARDSECYERHSNLYREPIRNEDNCEHGQTDL